MRLIIINCWKRISILIPIRNLKFFCVPMFSIINIFSWFSLCIQVNYSFCLNFEYFTVKSHNIRNFKMRANITQFLCYVQRKKIPKILMKIGKHPTFCSIPERADSIFFCPRFGKVECFLGLSFICFFAQNKQLHLQFLKWKIFVLSSICVCKEWGFGLCLTRYNFSKKESMFPLKDSLFSTGN